MTVSDESLRSIIERKKAASPGPWKWRKIREIYPLAVGGINYGPGERIQCFNDSMFALEACNTAAEMAEELLMRRSWDLDCTS